jgi:glycosyltransferase involved in cell wall biosynthesis
MLPIAYVSNASVPGRAPSLAYSAHASRGFVDAGADVRLLLRLSTQLPAGEALREATGVSLPDVVGLRAPRLGGSLRLFYRSAFSHLVASDRRTILFRDINFAPWAARLRRSGRRVFFEAHEYWGDEGPRDGPTRRSVRRKIRLARRFLPGVDGVFCTSAAQAPLYRDRFPALPVWLALTGTRPPTPNLRSEFSYTLGYFGSLSAPYPVSTVVEALARCRTEAVRLLVVGARNEAERSGLVERAAALGVADRLEVHGWVPPADLAAFRERIDVGVVPLSSSFKTLTNTPLKLLDYLSASLPSIATHADVVTTYVTDGREALLTGESPDAWAAAIDTMYGDFSAYRRMADAALARARDVTWERRALRMLQDMDGVGT